ncbi:MAG: response regulator, partial [Planctomycetes bacterium]|nr:response regulator [Planctomycetota bacterium]
MTVPRATASVLLVEDDESLRRVLTHELIRSGHRVQALPDASGL